MKFVLNWPKLQENCRKYWNKKIVVKKIKIKLANWGLKNSLKNQKIKVVPNLPKWGDNWSEIVVDNLIFPQHIIGECENSFN